jgi:hypothetical protein
MRSDWLRIVQKATRFLYPFLLAFYPVLALRNHNITYVDLSIILRTLILVTAGTLLISVITYLILRDQTKSSIIVSAIILLFLSYGHFYLWLQDVLGYPIRHRYLVGAVLLVLLGIAFLVLKNDQAAGVISRFLAVTSVLLLAIVLFESVRYDLQVFRATSAAAQAAAPQAGYQDGEKPPDFYLILLDGYTRSDVLRERFDYDNASFIRQLSDMGFYVSSCSQSNYASTKLSLTSAFYGDYIENIIEKGGVLPPLRSSPLNQTLESLGYKTITFESRAHGQFDLKEDIRLSRNQLALGKFDLRGGINEFEKMMIDTSFIRFIYETELIPGFDSDTLAAWERWEHYFQTHYILSELEAMPEMPGPIFVFAHIMVPHSPYIFAPDGSFFRDTNAIRGYRSNTEFLDNRLPSILHAIIEKSDVPPIIVVMGDHGPATRSTITKQMRMATLNAYYVNGVAKAQMYPKMTPINAFRIILNAHFSEDYPLVEDDSLYAYKPAELEDADSVINECVP